MSKLTVAALPLNITPQSRAANLDALEQAIAVLPERPDVLVLPELFSTGFVADRDAMVQLAENDNGTTMSHLRTLAAQYRMAICGSFLGRNYNGTEFYNRAFFVEPNGDTTFCNKRHLFCLSPEAELCTPGHNEYGRVRFRGWNIAFGVCYDLRFPVWCRNVMHRGRPAYDIFLFVANWPRARAYALDTLLKARAIENIAYTVCANRSGEDRYGNYDGLSVANDFMGKTLAQSSEENPSEPIFMTADSDALADFRKKLPAALDADNFTLL